MVRDATLASFCTSWNAPKELHVAPADSFDSIDTCESSQVRSRNQALSDPSGDSAAPIHRKDSL